VTDAPLIRSEAAAAAESEGLRREVEALRADRLKLARWIARQHENDKPFPWNVYDHACAECIPGGPLVSPGFRCAVHVARALSPSPSTQETPNE
jgi:hypothetical protein